MRGLPRQHAAPIAPEAIGSTLRAQSSDSRFDCDVLENVLSPGVVAWPPHRQMLREERERTFGRERHVNGATDVFQLELCRTAETPRLRRRRGARRWRHRSASSRRGDSRTSTATDQPEPEQDDRRVRPEPRGTHVAQPLELVRRVFLVMSRFAAPLWLESHRAGVSSGVQRRGAAGFVWRVRAPDHERVTASCRRD